MKSNLQNTLNDIAQEFISKISEAVRTQIIESLSNGEPVLIHDASNGVEVESNGHSNGHTEKKPRKAVSREVQKARQRHGRYLGLCKGLNATQRKQMKKLRAEKGVDAAISAIEKMA